MALTAPVNQYPAESPEWWLVRLALRLQERKPDLDLLDRLFRGDHPMPTEDTDLDDFRAFQKTARSNYLALVVEAALERLRVIGILTRAEEQGSTLNREAWKLWQSSSLDADQVLVHRTALSLRRAYVIVVPHPRKTNRVLISPEDPREVIVETWPEDRREVRAALKLTYDAVRNRDVAYVYLMDGVHVYDGPERDSLTKAERSALWTPDTFNNWTFSRRMPNPTPGEIPVVEFANRPGLGQTASAEFEDVIDIQNRINATLLHRLIAEKFAVIRQRMLLNLEFDEEEILDAEGNSTGETHTVVPELPNDPRAVWLLQGDKLTFAETSQTSTSDILSGVEADIRDLAAITRTPPHYLLNSIVNASGDALKSAETGLVSKVKEHISQFADSWERVMHLALRISRIEIEATDLEIRWADPESRSLAEIYDAASKAVVAGETWAARMRLIGHSPEEIAAMEIERTQDAFLAALAQPATPATPGAQDDQTEEPDAPAEPTP